MQRLLSELTMRLRTLLHRRRSNQELEDELRAHLEMEIEDLVKRGYSQAEATRQAGRTFGGLGAIREQTREQRGTLWIEDAARDLRLGARSMLRAPRFTVAALISLALGVGAVTVIFAVVDAVLLTPLPYARTHELVELNEITPEGDRFSTSDLNLVDFRERSRTLAGIAAMSFPSQNLLFETSGTNGGEALRLRAAPVTGNFFELLGVTPILGRSWTEDETAPGTQPRSVLLGHALWQQSFGGDGDIVGRPVRLGGEQWTVLGVLPAEFRFGADTDLWIPYPLNLERDRGDHRLSAYARLAPGVSLAAAEAELQSIAAKLGDQYPDDAGGWSAELRPLEELFLGAEVRTTSIALSIAVALLLLLACANVSSLLLARSTSRLQELAMRYALGASKARIVRQLLAESALLGAGGALLGMLLAFFVLPLIRNLGAEALPRIDDATLDLRALGLTVVVALSTALFFGTFPAIRRSSGHTDTPAGPSLVRGAGEQRHGLRSALVVGQLSLALILSSSSLLLLDGFAGLRAIPTGFEVDQLVAVDVALPADRYPEGSEAVTAFYREVLDEVRALPGVETAGASTLHPFRGPALANTVGLPEQTERSDFVEIAWRAITPGALRSLGVPLLRGRDFRDSEEELVTILNALLAERLFPGEDPIGRQVRWIAPQGPLARVIGVVADSRDLEIAEAPPPTYYWHQGQMRWPDLTLMVRASTTPEQLTGPLRSAVRGVDPLLPPPEISLVSDDLKASLATPRLNFQVFGAFAFVALAIALVGIYGLVSFSAASRRGELALRVALGAQPGNIRSHLMRQGVRLLGLGLALGLIGVVLISRVLDDLLLQSTGLDPLVVLYACLAFSGATLLACLLPALRAARQSPLRALREE